MCRSGDYSASACRFVPAHLHLAVSELDEKHMGRFSFRNTDTILQVPGSPGVVSFPCHYFRYRIPLEWSHSHATISTPWSGHGDTTA